ncbi:MAG TPA: glycoside hydrolase family 2 TIM barrel-domain containing protein [Bacteroidales bacterium]|nr:glycoside hydrolase family 2 TIM barrel-domain containing protein [Bacteroidales bacterium]HRX95453.1 glycoside hydrolase family 2 TIM barrel-domain containing protein [Bacteroidales bacterium]
MESNHERVSVSGRQILVDGTPYFIKGVCYHPVPKGSNSRDFAILDKDLELMKEAGINTIRVYSPILERSVLDKISKAGIKVIIGFGYNQGGNHDILSGTFIDYVNEFKEHKAILFWELGNEYNYHPEWFEGNIENWYLALNNAAIQIHKSDLNHPVATAHGELPDTLSLAMCTDIDIWGMNVYRWDRPGSVFKEWSEISSKPMYLSEAGTDSYMTISAMDYQQGENQRAQADAITNILDDVLMNSDICSGVAVFAFNDEWWKAGNNDQQDIGGWAPKSTGVPYDGAPNEEYWGIVDIERNKKKAFEVVKTKYNSIP